MRSLLPKCWFDADRCAKGVEALKLYRSDYDEKHGVMRPRPIHDWTSHCADSFRMAAISSEFIGAGSRVANFNRRIEMPLHVGGLMARQFVTWHTAQTPHGPCSWAVVDGLLHVRSALALRYSALVRSTCTSLRDRFETSRKTRGSTWNRS